MNEYIERMTNAMAAAVDKFDERYDRLCENFERNLQNLGPAIERASATYRKAFEAAAKSLPGWSLDKDGWLFKPGEEILTRDEAFSGLHKRRKKGKVIRP